MKLASASNYVLAAASSGAGLLSKELMTSRLDLSQLDAIGASVIASVATFVVLSLVMALPSSFPAWRRLRKPESELEGDWVEEVEKAGVPYHTIFSVLYRWNSDKYEITGSTFDPTGRLHAAWNSGLIEFGTNQVRFVYHAVQGKPVHGYAQITFARLGGRTMLGKGSLIEESQPTPHQLDFAVTRVTALMKRELLGACPKVMTPTEQWKLILNYQEMRRNNNNLIESDK
jgi:hypothetical protein